MICLSPPKCLRLGLVHALFIKITLEWYKMSNPRLSVNNCVRLNKMSKITGLSSPEHFRNHESRRGYLFLHFKYYAYEQNTQWANLQWIYYLFLPSWELKHLWLILFVSCCAFHNSFLRGLYQGAGGREAPPVNSRCPADLRDVWHTDDGGDGRKGAAAPGMTYLRAWGGVLLGNYWS